MAVYTDINEVDLKAFLERLGGEIPVMALGLGSNMIVRDGGVPGVVVRLGKSFAKVEHTGEMELTCGGGASGRCARSQALSAWGTNCPWGNSAARPSSSSRCWPNRSFAGVAKAGQACPWTGKYARNAMSRRNRRRAAVTTGRSRQRPPGPPGSGVVDHLRLASFVPSGPVSLPSAKKLPRSRDDICLQKNSQGPD